MPLDRDVVVTGKILHSSVKSLLLMLFLVTGCDGIQLASVDSANNQVYLDSGYPDISATGQYVVFASNAEGADGPDPNSPRQIQVRDLQTQTTVQASVGVGGVSGDASSHFPAISGDGQRVVFESYATNLVADNSDWLADIYLRDIAAGQTIRISNSYLGGEANSESYDAKISADGQLIVFTSTATDLIENFTGNAVFSQLYSYDVQSGTIELVSIGVAGAPGNHTSRAASVSDDGRYIAFLSSATNLTNEENNGGIYIRDTVAGVTERVNIGFEGDPVNGSTYELSLSADGRYIAFESIASNLVLNDNSGFSDIFVHDRNTGITSLVSISSTGEQANSYSYFPSISGDGRYVAFSNTADNLVDDDNNQTNDIFVRDRTENITWRVSTSNLGAEGDAPSWWPRISSNGRNVTYFGAATNLVANDNYAGQDVFVRTLLKPVVSDITPGSLAIGSTATVVINGSGFELDAVPVIGGAVLFNVVVVDENTITADVAVASDSAPGSATLLVVIDDISAGAYSGATAICEDCVTLF